MSTEGTWGHSSLRGKYFITSATDFTAFRKFLADNKINNKEVEGYWQNMKEPAWVINQDNLGIVYESGLISDQQYILMLGDCDARDRSPAVLHPIAAETGPINLGLYQSVAQEVAEASLSGYTYDPTRDAYFVAGPDRDIPTRSNPANYPMRHVR